MWQAWQEAGCGLTRPAVNWAAWCGPELLLEVRLPCLEAVFPVRLRHAPRMETWALREWAPDECEIRGAWEWVPDGSGGEVVLHPLHQYYDREKRKLSGIEVDRRVTLRMDATPVPAGGRRLPAVGSEAEAAHLESLAGCLVRLALHPPEVAITRVVSRPFQIARVASAGTDLGLYGPGPVRLELRGVRVQRVRDGGAAWCAGAWWAGWLVDVWHEQHGYMLSFYVYGAGAGAVQRGGGQRHRGKGTQAAELGGQAEQDGLPVGATAPPGQPVATPEAAAVQMRLPLW